MTSYVEHINMTVSDTGAAIAFIQTAVPDFRIRNRWHHDGYEWTHIGTDTSYIALMRPLAGAGAAVRHDTNRPGYNHVCIVVESVEAVERSLSKAGYTRGFNNGEVIATKVRKSVYFHDPDGNEFEFMQYLTVDREARNSYEI